MFSQHYVRPVAPFFDYKRDALLRMTRSRGEKPLVVLLVSGWHFENQFEYSFLAGLWGFPMVTGPDLTVRDSRVYLKTLGGLEPVHAIVRGIDDSLAAGIAEYASSKEQVRSARQGGRRRNMPGITHPPPPPRSLSRR